MRKKYFSSSRRQVLKLACGTAAGSLLWACQDKKPSSSVGVGGKITVFHNGTVLPVDDRFSEHQAFAIQDNKILAVGSNETVLSAAGSKAELIDLQGRTVLPGFIEPHVHTYRLLSFIRASARSIS